MNGRERVLAAIQCQEVDRAPWVPFAGCHAGALIDASAEAFLKSEDLIVQGVQAAINRYQPDGVPVAFDLQVEAETFGCELKWAEDNPPAVTSHPLALGVALDSLSVPSPEAGRLPILLGATRRLREANPDVALYGLVTGPFTLALHLNGPGIFMTMFEDPAEVERVMGFCRDVAAAMSDCYIEAGVDVVALVDPMTSQIGPDQFHQFVRPFVEPVFDRIRERGTLGSFFVCGHAQQNIEAMCECRPDNVSVDENIPLDFVRDQCLPRGISFGGNLQLTTVLLLGTPDDAQRNAVACLETGGDRGFLLAPGCDLPYATPPANLEAVGRVVRDPYQREILKAKVGAEQAADLLDMRDYGQSNRVIVDVITLDSEACAPCQYMVAAVKEVAPEFEGIVEWREHKIKYRESLVFMSSLMVKNIPTICIDGRITFVSRIPPRDELVAAIQKRIIEKLRMSIQRLHASVFILGDGGEKCQEIQRRTERAALELGSKAKVKMVTDTAEMLSYGVLPAQTPAVVTAKYMLKSTREVPEVPIIKEWIKDIRLG